jgi:hypothetical protein
LDHDLEDVHVRNEIAQRGGLVRKKEEHWRVQVQG